MQNHRSDLWFKKIWILLQSVPIVNVTILEFGCRPDRAQGFKGGIEAILERGQVTAVTASPAGGTFCSL